MKKVLSIILVVIMLATIAAEPAAAKTKHKHAKAKVTVEKVTKCKAKTTKIKKVKVKAKAIHCPNCDGKSHDCPYWFIDQSGKGRHMTDEEIAEFEWLEWHYQDESGEWVER